MKEKMFHNVDTSSMYYKSFMIVTYDRNNSSQYYKTVLLAKGLFTRPISEHDFRTS
jgi:hypothetical protein